MSNEEIKKKLFEKIHGKKVSMHTKAYFILRLCFIIFLSAFTFLLIAFTLSFVFFSIHESREHYLLGFGPRGVLTFLELFPWAIVIFTAVIFFVLEWLVHYFRFSYRLPMVRIFLYTLVITIFLGILVTFTPVHMNLLKEAENNKLPIIGRIYDDIRDSHQAQGVTRSTIISVGTSTFVVSHNDNDNDTDDGTWNVVPPQGFNLSSVYVGEKVYVAGDIKGQYIYAYGIREITD